MGQDILFLTGFLSAGKSTVGQLLAQRMGVPFLDLDLLLEARLGRPVEQVLVEHGELFYRTVEAEILAEVGLRPPCVVALGAGTLTYPRSREIIRRHGILVWLAASYEELWRRTEEQERWARLWLTESLGQGLPGRETLQERMKAILDLRLPQYELADIVVDTTEISPEEAVDQILHQLRIRNFPLLAAGG
ncbi:MAG: hypothetical protein ONB23_02460 [candidate division KSB1 bacterium]|nr:hypothetical protein [candidate division KSB1 bacterium]